MMNNIDKDAFIYAVVAFIGFIGGILGIGNGNTKLNGSGWSRFVSATIVTFSSMFLCFVTYEVIFFIFGSSSLGVAIGGLIAWLGAEWSKKKVDRFFNKKIDAIASKDYGDEMSDYERNLK